MISFAAGPGLGGWSSYFERSPPVQASAGELRWTTAEERSHDVVMGFSQDVWDELLRRLDGIEEEFEEETRTIISFG